MAQKTQLNNIWLVARNEYRKWLFNPKIIVLFAALLPLRIFYIEPLLHGADIMNRPINLLEPLIATLTMGILPLTIIYLILIAGFPTADGNMLMYVFRMGRRNWILGEILFQFMSVVTYNLILIVSVSIQVIGRSFLINGWSTIVTDFDSLYPEEGRISKILPPNIWFQLPPYRALAFSVILFTLLLLSCGMIFLLGCLYHKKLLFFTLHISHIVLGFAMLTLRSRFMWFFPISHAILSYYYQKYLRKYIFSPYISILLYSIVLIGSGILVYRKAICVNVDSIEGDILS